MARMNWNRPNGGYEPEPWRKKSITKRQFPKPKKIDLGIHAKHEATVIGPRGPHAGGLYCVECKKLITWLSQKDYNTYERLK